MIANRPRAKGPAGLPRCDRRRCADFAPCWCGACRISKLEFRFRAQRRETASVRVAHPPYLPQNPARIVSGRAFQRFLHSSARKRRMHVNRSCLGIVNPTFPQQIHLKGFTMKKILVAVLSLAIGAAAFAQSGAPAPAAQTATASPEAASAAVAKHKAKHKARKAAKAAKAASAM
jgi:hypothetical protein